MMRKCGTFMHCLDHSIWAHFGPPYRTRSPATTRARSNSNPSATGAPSPTYPYLIGHSSLARAIPDVEAFLMLPLDVKC
ncbi:hypothetical protein CUMW_110020 [Citrus unshiu]|nr:hypothetical protein CUMW_110020 [Citrus unshiu]